MSLIDDIISSVTETKEPVSDILRRCLVLAYKLKNEALKTWVEKELNGYSNSDELPDYRKSSGVAKGLFLGGFGSELRDQPLVSSVMQPQHRHYATEIRLTQPIAAYQDADKRKNAAIYWPQDLVAMYQSEFYEGMALNRAWMEIPSSKLVGTVDTVRTRILTFALQMRDELPKDADLSVSNISPAVVERMVHVTIYGGSNVIGDVGEFSSHVVIAGDVQTLNVALSDFGVTENELSELGVCLREDGASPSQDGERGHAGPRTLGWISRTAKRFTKAGLKIGGAVAEEAIRRAVFSYLGM